jgi:hypothetical protein
MLAEDLDPKAWEDRCVHSESTLHQLSPFLGKMKSTMAKELVNTFSDPGDRILDPFSGSGTVPLEGAICQRAVVGIDRNPYSVLLTKAKLHPPSSEQVAKERVDMYMDRIEPIDENPPDDTPDWVRDFFHPKTLAGIEELTRILQSNQEHFLMACLLGILHHQRPGFLSYPASHLRPYLRDEKFPREEYPDRYEYREIRPRLRSKVERAYRRFPSFDSSLNREVLEGNTPEVLHASISDESVDAIITSPPYMNKLDYGRDNRLRLYFLGVDDYTDLDGSPDSRDSYRDFLDRFLSEAVRVLSPHSRLVFVLGESRRSGAAVDTSEVLIEMVNRDLYDLSINTAIKDKVPVREINSMSSEEETIMILEKNN